MEIKNVIENASCKPHHMTYKTKECDKLTTHMQ